MSEFPAEPTLSQQAQIEKQREHELRLARINAAALILNGYYISNSDFKAESMNLIQRATNILAEELS